MNNYFSFENLGKITKFTVIIQKLTDNFLSDYKHCNTIINELYKYPG